MKNFIIAVLVLIIVIGGSFIISIFNEKDYDFIDINISNYLTIKKENKRSIIYIYKEGCEYCEKETPLLKEIGKKYNLKIYQLNFSLLSMKDQKILMESDEYLKKGYSVPLIMLTKNDKGIAFLKGFHEIKDIITFFEEQDIL